MPTLDDLLGHYRRQVALPWLPDTAPSGRVWILWHAPALERRVRGQMHEFEAATRAAGRGWKHFDLAPVFPRWITGHELFGPLLDQPEELRGLLPEFARHVALEVRTHLDAAGAEDVVAVSGCGALFGLASVAEMTERVSPAIRGRLLLFFPGTHAAGVYRLLDARSGWNYHAVPIPAVDAS